MPDGKSLGLVSNRDRAGVKNAGKAGATKRDAPISPDPGLLVSS